MLFSGLAALGMGGRDVSRNDRSRRRVRPVVAGSEPLKEMERRIVPTVVAGPFYNPQDGVTTTLTEVSTQGGPEIQAVISLASNAAPVKYAFVSSGNATVDSTSSGAHNNGQQYFSGVASSLVLSPGQTVTLDLPEGYEGTTGGCDPVNTYTQFDVYVDPLCDVTGSETANVAAAIAYNPTNPTPPQDSL